MTSFVGATLEDFRQLSESEIAVVRVFNRKLPFLLTSLMLRNSGTDQMDGTGQNKVKDWRRSPNVVNRRAC